MNYFCLTFVLTALTTTNALFRQYNLQNINDQITNGNKENEKGQFNDNLFNRLESVNLSPTDPTSINNQNIALNSQQNNALNQLSTTTSLNGLNSVVNPIQGSGLNPSVMSLPSVQNSPSPSMLSNSDQHLTFNRFDQSSPSSIKPVSVSDQNMVFDSKQGNGPNQLFSISPNSLNSVSNSFQGSGLNLLYTSPPVFQASQNPKQVNLNPIDPTSINNQNIALNSQQNNALNQLSTTTSLNGLNSVVNPIQGSGLNPSVMSLPSVQSSSSPSMLSNPVQHLTFNKFEQVNTDSAIPVPLRKQVLVTSPETVLNSSGTPPLNSQNSVSSLQANEASPSNPVSLPIDNKPGSPPQQPSDNQPSNSTQNPKSILDWLKEFTKPNVEQKSLYDEKGINYPWKNFGKVSKMPFKLPFKIPFSNGIPGKSSKEKSSKADPTTNADEHGVPYDTSVVETKPKSSSGSKLKKPFNIKFKNPFGSRGSKSGTDSTGKPKKGLFKNPFSGRGSKSKDGSDGKEKNKFKNPFSNFKNPFSKSKIGKKGYPASKEDYNF